MTLDTNGSDSYYQVPELSPWALVKAAQEPDRENGALKSRLSRLEGKRETLLKALAGGEEK
ncbi:MAG: hypothetical protein HYY37_03365 [Candidatus Aenigmarchaeota archaeon]|nr:hypothetical protein [Candidatus Aenigmarchaeota archaeon]